MGRVVHRRLLPALATLALLVPSTGGADTDGPADALTDLVNDARHDARQCGDQRFEPTRPIRWNPVLAAAAKEHAEDMAQRRYFAHEAPDGGNVDTRVSGAGYRWRAVGENIAKAPGDPRRVMELWLQSPGHCANIMNTQFREIGAAFVPPENERSNGYWVLVFATPR